MAAIELKWFMALLIPAGAIARVEHIPGKCLDRRGWKYRRQFGDMCAAIDAGESMFDVRAKAVQQIQADQFFICVADRIAVIRVRNGIGYGFRIDNVQLSVDRDPQG